MSEGHEAKDSMLTRRRALATGGVMAAALGGLLSSGVPTASAATSNFKKKAGFTILAPTKRRKAALADLETVKELGLGWVRFGIPLEDILNEWGEGDSPNNYDEEALTDIAVTADRAHELGLKVCLMSVEGHYSKDDAEYTRQMKKHWADLAERFASKVDQWQVYNEANQYHYRDYVDVPEDELDDYQDDLAEKLSIARSIIRAENPDVLVTHNLGGWPVSDETEQSWIHALDHIADSLDLITVDAYPVDNMDEIEKLPKRIARLSSRYGKDVFIGEIGVQICSTCCTVDQQTNAYAAYMEMVKDSRIDGMIFYRLSDYDPESDTGEESFAPGPEALDAIREA